MQQLNYKLSSHKWPINCASPEDVKDVPLAIAKSEWAGYHRHYMNIAAKIDTLDNIMMGKFNTIIAKENTLMKNFGSKVDNLENTLVENFNSKICNSENTLKELKKSVSNYNNVMLNEIVSLVQTSMIQLLNETSLKESKDCPSEIGKEVNSNNEMKKILFSLTKC